MRQTLPIRRVCPVEEKLNAKLGLRLPMELKSQMQAEARRRQRSVNWVAIQAFKMLLRKGKNKPAIKP